jgi:hypothetical protein
MLASRLNLTNLEEEQEPYILTKEEEDRAIAYAIENEKKHKAYRYAQRGLSEMEILKRVSEDNWDNCIDKAAVLKRYNSNKVYGIWQNEQREKEKNEKEEKQAELRKFWTAKRMFGLMKWSSESVLGKDLIVHKDNKKLITTLCYFLSEDEKLETELGFSKKRGLLIRGISGIGKTFLVRCLEHNELNPIKILSMLEIADEVRSEGEYRINLGDNKIIYLDDVGTEEATINHYGTKINFFKQFMEMIYLRNKTFNKLMISTNNSFSEIEEKYGFRVRSRIKDMFNIIDVAGKDMRGLE